jgi:hypothetical protein
MAAAPLAGVALVFGNVVGSNLIHLTDVATVLGATVCEPRDAALATHLVASNVLKRPNGDDPYLVCGRASVRTATLPGRGVLWPLPSLLRSRSRSRWL